MTNGKIQFYIRASQTINYHQMIQIDQADWDKLKTYTEDELCAKDGPLIKLLDVDVADFEDLCVQAIGIVSKVDGVLTITEELEGADAK